MDILNISAFLASLGGVVFLMFKLSDRAEKSFNLDAKKRLSSWLLNIKVPESETISIYYFIDLFEEIFSKKHFSFKCLNRSMLASIISFLVLAFPVFRQFVADIVSIAPPELASNTFILIVMVIVTTISTLVLNMIVDYFSLLETRYLLYIFKAKKLKNYSSKILLLVFDAIFTFFLMALIYSSILYFQVDETGLPISDSYSWFDSLIMGIEFLTSILLGMLTGSSEAPAMARVIFSTTFLTSIWIWLHLLSTSALRLLTYSKPALDFFKKYLDIEKMPFNAIAFVSSVLVTIAYIIVGIFTLV